MLAEIVGTTGAAIDTFESIFTKEEHEETLVEISVLRYPDPDQFVFYQLLKWTARNLGE